MPPPETNPLHIYRACLRECTYLPLPQCRTYMRKFTIDSFRRWIPRNKGPEGKSRTARRGGGSGGGGRQQDLPPEKVTRLLHQARKLASILRHANQGYINPLENVLRMTYGRKGPRKYDLLEKFLQHPAGPTSKGDQGPLKDREKPNPSTAEAPLTDAVRSAGVGLDEVLRDDAEEISESTIDKETLYPSLLPTVTTAPHDNSAPRSSTKRKLPNDKWKHEIPPRLLALITSQAGEQIYFTRVGAHLKVKPRFNPPQTTIWGTPLPQSRYKNLRIKWYNHNIKAVLPPLPEDEYQELHDLVSGKKEVGPFVTRRRPTRTSTEDMEQSWLECQSSLILEGPQPGSRLKDWHIGRPHEITPRLLRRLLSRVVLKQTPFAKSAAPNTKEAADIGLVFYWDDGMSRDEMEKAQRKISESLRGRQSRLLFG
ncbi:hypothetical protein Z517_02353 [Fonsecaea pedrosoi CBS 271.37]|uniref:LYR motif-containing protein Cup1-like N-terminal domain-containing protein n=1 Tax=Fonsecaea pedrosoi CBS 271.37 TaxID=1442368 RepID=A0A0D2HFA7_9EURO|nr:uncharacterized protein Z517_02353 [Fonsecaea pedrosoi CBS 271.37]KIW83109.1 hypothetical protein Z517_02353 [Fonsecaea pedrosoi CBS 271.37]